MADQDDHGHPTDASQAGHLPITLTHQGKEHTFDMSPGANLIDLATSIEEELYIPISNQKFMVPKLGLLKPPSFGDRAITDLRNKKITLIGTSSAEIVSLAEASSRASLRQVHLESARRNQPKAYTTRREKPGDSQYTFLQLRPLPGLPHPERSLAFLKRLSEDPGIRTAMRAHKFSVGLLTEMDPTSYTESSHEGTTRILGLNRNKGEVIELRLRTDAYDGYRDYKTIRNTLCHELAHNVHGPHDKLFWDLCHQIEKEVARADWKSEGHTVSGDNFSYEPSEEVAYDHGGWTGGEFVLGGGGGGGGRAGTRSSDPQGGALSRREIMAKAAEERVKKQKQAQADSKEDSAGAKDS